MEMDVKPKIPVIKSDPLSEPDTEDDFDYPAKPAVPMELEEPDTEDESVFDRPVVKSKPTRDKKQPSPVLTVPDTEDDFPAPVLRYSSVKGKERKHSPTPPTSVSRSLHCSSSKNSIVSHIYENHRFSTDVVSRLSKRTTKNQRRNAESLSSNRYALHFRSRLYPHNFQLIQKSYPRVAKKGRPKFKILDADQEAIGHFPLNIEGARINAHINRFLRPYQQEGIKFLFVERIVCPVTRLILVC